MSEFYFLLFKLVFKGPLAITLISPTSELKHPNQIFVHYTHRGGGGCVRQRMCSETILDSLQQSTVQFSTFLWKFRKEVWEGEKYNNHLPLLSTVGQTLEIVVLETRSVSQTGPSSLLAHPLLGRKSVPLALMQFLWITTIIMQNFRRNLHVFWQLVKSNKMSINQLWLFMTD